MEGSNLQSINFRLYIQIVLNPDYIIQVKVSLCFNVVILYTYKCEFLKLKEISSHNQQLFHNTIILLITKSSVQKWGGLYSAHYHMCRGALVSKYLSQVLFAWNLYYTIIQETIIAIRFIFITVSQKNVQMIC